MNMRFVPVWFAVALQAMNLTASAEDIDLFVQPAADVVGRPNVLLIIDNTANWNTAFANEKAAIVNTFNNLPLNKFNVGVMMYSDPDVGYVRAAIRPMDKDNRPLYAAMFNGMVNENDNKGGDRSTSGRTLARTFSEAYRYLKGQQSTSPKSTLTIELRDYPNNPSGRATTRAVHALPGNALPSPASTVYNSPLDEDNCFGTYIIYIGNTVPGGNVTKDDSNRNRDAGDELAAAGGNTRQIALPYVSHQDNNADEWARFLKQDPTLGVVTYTIDVDPTPMPGGHVNGMGNSALLESMAKVGGGKYFRVNSAVGGGAEIQGILEEIFSEIQAVNSVFASVSLPLSVNTQETYLNQVYVGVFRPNAGGMPRWDGNLKQYKLGLVGDKLVTLDADDKSAVNSLTGFVTECARSFWTPAAPGGLDGYWSFDPQGACEVGTEAERLLKKQSNSPDGNVVEKGGQAYVQRSAAARTMKTCSNSVFACSDGLVNFNNENVSQADLLAATVAETDALIDWHIGRDVDDERLNGDTVERRPSLHGDVVHSRPFAMNYGPADAPQVVVFYSGNDGVLRAVNGNRGENIGAVPAGRELWAFTPPEFFGQIKRLRDNNKKYKYFGNDDVTAKPKPYGLDGAITAYIDDDDTHLFVTARRGGRVVYAFDVTDIATDPTSPTLLWKIGCPNANDDVGCTSASLARLGQTWSAAKPIKTEHSSKLLIMGGGYDPCEDADPITDACRDSGRGDRVYVLNRETGTVLKAFPTTRGVIADVFVVPDKTTGLAKYAYAVDLGGNVYRISGVNANSPFEDSAPSDWTITKIASLGCNSPAVCTPNRKFMFSPDVVEKGEDYYLLLGSGDREKPLKDFASALSVENYFFMVRDRPTAINWLSEEFDECGSNVICRASLVPILDNDDPTKEDLAAKKGWYLALQAGEQVVTSAITVYGTTTFSTHTPADPEPGACTSNLGIARVYNIGFANAKSRNAKDNRFEVVAGGGLPPSPVAGLVLLDGMKTPTPFIIGADPDSPLQSRRPIGPSTTQQPKSLTYWYIEK
jgi:type IV pilus assembly protein PilY1